jgi:hypothetical protein
MCEVLFLLVNLEILRTKTEIFNVNGCGGFINKASLSAKSKIQESVVLSVNEAELVAPTRCA